MASIRGSLGLKRIPKATNVSVAGNTRAVRTQVKTLLANMNRVIDRIKGTSEEALVYGLMPTYREALKLVPRDTHKLADSIYLETRMVSGSPVAELGFAKGGNPFYAILVHELMDLQHEPPTQAKYLEEAFNRHVQEIPRRVSSFIKQNLGT